MKNYLYFREGRDVYRGFRISVRPYRLWVTTFVPLIVLTILNNFRLMYRPCLYPLYEHRYIRVNRTVSGINTNPDVRNFSLTRPKFRVGTVDNPLEPLHSVRRIRGQRSGHFNPILMD